MHICAYVSYVLYVWMCVRWWCAFFLWPVLPVSFCLVLLVPCIFLPSQQCTVPVFMVNEVRSGSFICMRSWRGQYCLDRCQKIYDTACVWKNRKLCMLPDRQKWLICRDRFCMIPLIVKKAEKLIVCRARKSPSYSFFSKTKKIEARHKKPSSPQDTNRDPVP